MAGTVSGILTLRPSKGWRAQTLGTPAARDAGASIAAVEASTRLRVIITRGSGKALSEKSPKCKYFRMRWSKNDHLCKQKAAI